MADPSYDDLVSATTATSGSACGRRQRAEAVEQHEAERSAKAQRMAERPQRPVTVLPEMTHEQRAIINGATIAQDQTFRKPAESH
jgi:hypothetical protein